MFCYASFNSIWIEFPNPVCYLRSNLELASEVEMYSQLNYKEHTTQVTIHCECIEKSIKNIFKTSLSSCLPQKKNKKSYRFGTQ